MKIALYLGSFNPFHNGHLHVIKTALDNFKMDALVIVPSMQNPWKKDVPLDIEKRVGIIHSYFYFNREFYTIRMDYYTVLYRKKIIKIDLIEKDLIPPYYSYATLHTLKNKYCNHEIFVLCGEDTIKDIPNWMNGEAIIKDYNFLIVDRPKNGISSTEIRQKIKDNESLEGLVPNNVINLIKKHY